MSVKDLTRSLVAVGSAMIPDDEEQGIYLLSVSSGNLVEKLWVGDEVKNQTVIASDAKEDTSAAYVLDVEQGVRLVFFIDQSHAPQCYTYNDESEEWEETPLGKKWNITTSLNSKLSANVGPEGEIVISYQDKADRLAGMKNVGKGEWKAFGPLEADPVSGTPQYLEVIDNKLHLFYVGKDFSVHYLLLDPGTGKWQDNVINNAKFDSPVENFSVVQDPKTGTFQSYFLTGGSLWSVSGDSKICLGKVEANGKLILANNAQAGRRISWRGAKHVRIRGSAVDIWY